MIVNGLAIGIPVAAAFAVGVAIWVITGRDTGQHKADPLTHAYEVHHDEYPVIVPGRPPAAGGADVEAGTEATPAVPAALTPPGPVVLATGPGDPHQAAAQAMAAVKALTLDDYTAGLAGYEHETAWFAAIGSDA